MKEKENMSMTELEAIALDPESPAVHAKEMLDDILNFYNKDMYNP